MKYLVWIIEPDAIAAKQYLEILASLGDFAVFANASQLDKNNSYLNPPNLILSHIALGFEENLKAVPLVVIGNGEDSTFVRDCFKAGARDFISKPVRAGELLVRCERLLRGDTRSVAVLPKSDIDFMPQSLSLKRGKVEANLTAKELQIFMILYEAGGATVTRNTIQKQVWHSVSVSYKTFDVHLFNLRKKLWPLAIEIRFSPDGYTLVIGQGDSITNS